MVQIGIAIYILIFVLLIILSWIKRTFLYFSIAINLPSLPIAIMMGEMINTGPDATVFDFLLGFFIIQAIPLIILITNIVIIYRNRSKTKKENAFLGK